MSEWLVSSLGELATVEIGGTPAREVAEYWAQDGHAGHLWVSIADLGPRVVLRTKEQITELGIRFSNVKLVPEGSLIMSFKLTIGRTGIAGTDLYTNEAIAAIIPNNCRIEASFLYYVLPPAAKSAITDNAVKGVTLNKQKLRSLLLRFPRRLDEQKRIAEILSTIDQAIEKTESLIHKYQQIKAGLMHDLFSRGLTADGKLRPPREEAPELYKETPIGWIPPKWGYEPISSLMASLVDGPFGSNLKTEHYVIDPGVRVIRLQNIQASNYNDIDKAYVSERHANYLMRNKVVSGDIMIAGLGEDRYPVGRACQYPKELPSAINKADCFRLRCNTDDADNYFVMQYLNTPSARAQIRRYEQGVTRPRINLGNLKKIVIPKPALTEQKLISNRLRKVALRIEQELLVKKKLKKQKLGLMHDLLTGKVPVTIGQTENTNV